VSEFRVALFDFLKQPGAERAAGQFLDEQSVRTNAVVIVGDLICTDSEGFVNFVYVRVLAWFVPGAVSAK
jgi:hypothetical protein